MKKSILISFLIVLLASNYIVCEDNIKESSEDTEDYEELEESSSWDFDDLDKPKFTEPSRVMVLVREYGIEIFQCYLSAKAWILSKIK